MHKIVLLACQITHVLIFSLFVKVFGVLALHSMCIFKIAQLPGSLEECIFCIFLQRWGWAVGPGNTFQLLSLALHPICIWDLTWTYTTSVLSALVAVQKKLGQAGSINFYAWNTYSFMYYYTLPHHPHCHSLVSNLPMEVAGLILSCCMFPLLNIPLQITLMNRPNRVTSLKECSQH